MRLSAVSIIPYCYANCLPLRGHFERLHERGMFSSEVILGNSGRWLQWRWYWDCFDTRYSLLEGITF